MKKLFRVILYLEPLAITANITQSSFCRLDQVLLTFGFLVMQYQNLNEDAIACDAIINSLELRWKKADQELFIGAVLVNPFYRAEPFAPTHYMNIAGITSLLTRVWQRMNNERNVPPGEFPAHIEDFLLGKGYYQDIRTQITNEALHAQQVQFLLNIGELILHIS